MRLARVLKFRLKQVQVLYYPGSEQQRRWSDCADVEADLRLCCLQKQVFSWRGSYYPASKDFTSCYQGPSFLSILTQLIIVHYAGSSYCLAVIIIWTASSEFGTYRLCEQRRFRRACASAQSRQNLRYSLIQAVSQEEPSDRKPDPLPLWMAGHAQLKFVMTECSKTQIRLTGLISTWVLTLKTAEWLHSKSVGILG